MNPFSLSMPSRWIDGFKTGMLNYQPKAEPSFVDRLGQFTSSDSYKNAPESVKNNLLTAYVIQGLSEPNIGAQKELRRFESDIKAEEARRAQELGKESLKETLKAKMFYDLPGNVAKAFSGPASVLYAGMSQVPSVYNNAAAAFRPYSIGGTTVVSPGSVPNYFS